MRRVCQVLSDHLAQAGTAAIIGLDWPWDHWTVAICVTTTRLALLDSSGDPYLSLRRRRRESDRQRRLLRPRDVSCSSFVLSHYAEHAVRAASPFAAYYASAAPITATAPCREPIGAPVLHM
jgi:hypothetical protein